MGSVGNGVEERRGKIVAAPQVDRPNAHLKGNLKMGMGTVLGDKKKGMVWRWVDRRLRVAYSVLCIEVANEEEMGRPRLLLR